jgi:Pretoxin HINT domain
MVGNNVTNATDPSGLYLFAKDQANAYRMAVWFEGKGIETIFVDFSDGRRAVQVKDEGNNIGDANALLQKYDPSSDVGEAIAAAMPNGVDRTFKMKDGNVRILNRPMLGAQADRLIGHLAQGNCITCHAFLMGGGNFADLSPEMQGRMIAWGNVPVTSFDRPRLKLDPDPQPRPQPRLKPDGVDIPWPPPPIQDKGKACFAAGTCLLTPTGFKPIEDFKEGDKILSRSEFDPNGMVESKEVQEVFVGTGKIVHLHVNGQVIKTTGEHPFFAKDKGWVTATQLEVADLLVGDDGQWVAVEEVFDTGEWVRVYNLRIADHHTYFVTGEGWGFSVWAHNACVYRGISKQDVATLALGLGITSTKPGANDFEWEHIEEKTKDASDWISTSNSEKIARTKFGALGVVKIDLDLVLRWVDCSAGIPPKRPSTPDANRIAMGEMIVLVYQHIPQAAIEVLP